MPSSLWQIFLECPEFIGSVPRVRVVCRVHAEGARAPQGLSGVAGVGESQTFSLGTGQEALFVAGQRVPASPQRPEGAAIIMGSDIPGRLNA